jgi:hypothetical protein
MRGPHSRAETRVGDRESGLEHKRSPPVTADSEWITVKGYDVVAVRDGS